MLRRMVAPLNVGPFQLLRQLKNAAGKRACFLPDIQLCVTTYHKLCWSAAITTWTEKLESKLVWFNIKWRTTRFLATSRSRPTGHTLDTPALLSSHLNAARWWFDKEKHCTGSLSLTVATNKIPLFYLKKKLNQYIIPPLVPLLPVLFCLSYCFNLGLDLNSIMAVLTTSQALGQEQKNLIEHHCFL